VAAVLGIAAAALGFLHFRQASPQERVINATLLPPDGAEFDFNSSYSLPALSPDGSRIVFGARAKDGKTQLWLRRLDSPIAQPLPGTESAEFPFWSPDSKWVGFGQEARLKKIDTSGGPPITVADLGARFWGGTWSPDGVILLSLQGSRMPLWRVAAAGGTPVPVIPLEKGKESSSYRHPWFLPDGRHFLYTNLDRDTSVRVGSVDEPTKLGKLVAQAQSNAVYAEGHLLYLRENTLMAQPFDAARLQITGEAAPLAQGVPAVTQPSRAAAFTVATSGLLVYESGGVTEQSRLAWKDRQGKILGHLGEPTGRIELISLSPDGMRASAEILDRSGNRDIWIYDTVRGISTRLTFDPAVDTWPVWSPDGRLIYFTSNRRGQYDLYRKAADGSGEEQLVLADSESKTPKSLSPDGKLLFFSSRAKIGTDLWLLPLDPAINGPKQEPRPFLQSPFVKDNARFSPDGRWVAYDSNESGQYQVYVVAFPGPGGKRQISTTQSRFPRWRRDGRELFYRTADGELMATEMSVTRERSESAGHKSCLTASASRLRASMMSPLTARSSWLLRTV
jgi:Tol biopolymer transport system component